MWTTRSDGWPAPVRRAVQRPFDRAEAIVDLLTGAGFDDVQVHHEDTIITFASEQLNAWIVTGRVSRGRRTASRPPSQ